MNEYLFQLLPYGITSAYGNNEEQARKYFKNNDLNRLNHKILKVLAVRDTESGIWVKPQSEEE